MTSFLPDFGSRSPRLLFVGAHADDIEIGCGGTARALFESYPNASVFWVVLSGAPDRQSEARVSADRYLAGLPNAKTHFAGFRDGRFPYDASAIKELFDGPVKSFGPDIVFTHFRDDRHQDHRIASDLTWQTFRNSVVLEYEILKYDGDVGRPNAYVELQSSAVDQKIADLMACFESQKSKQWFDEASFRAMMRIRGVECAAESGYAEAFHARKMRIL